MSKLFWVLLLGLLLLTGFTARAQDEESGEGEEGNSEESNGEEAAKPKLDKLNKKAADKEVPLAPGLPPIKVEPLSADSPILKDDDGLFDTLQNNKILGSMESVERLTLSLKKAANLLRKMKLDVEGEKLWLKNVHEILQNYEFKYARTRKDVQKREAKIALLAKLVQELKGSVLQANVQQQLKNAKSALGELVSRSDNKKSKELTKIKQRIGRLQKSLAETRHSKPHSETAAQIHDILKSEVTPEAHDALSNLVALEVKAEVEEEDQAEEQVEQEESEEEESEEESEEEASEEESEEEESEEEVEEESTSNGKAQW